MTTKVSSLYISRIKLLLGRVDSLKGLVLMMLPSVGCTHYIHKDISREGIGRLRYLFQTALSESIK